MNFVEKNTIYGINLFIYKKNKQRLSCYLSNLNIYYENNHHYIQNVNDVKEFIIGIEQLIRNYYQNDYLISNIEKEYIKVHFNKNEKNNYSLMMDTIRTESVLESCKLELLNAWKKNKKVGYNLRITYQ